MIKEIMSGLLICLFMLFSVIFIGWLGEAAISLRYPRYLNSDKCSPDYQCQYDTTHKFECEIKINSRELIPIRFCRVVD